MAKKNNKVKRMNGAQAFFKTLVDAGVDTMFATPGTSEMQVIDELGYSDLHAVPCLFENSVTAMADGYARMKRFPALALVHVGAGLTNSLCNMHNASRAMVPMIVYSGHVAPYHESNNPCHIMKKRNPDLAATCADWIYEVKSPDEMAQAAANAFEIANQKPGKISFVYAPNNFAWGDVSLMTEPNYKDHDPVKVAKSTIETISEAIKQGNKEGKKTAFILGGSSCMGDELEAAGRVAEGAGGTLFQEHFIAGRLQKGDGRVRVHGIPYETADAQKLFSKYSQLVIVAAQIPVSEFSYKGKDLLKISPDTNVMTLTTVHNNILLALNDLADELGAPPTCSDRYKRAQVDKPSGLLTTKAIEQTFTALMPEDTIVVDDGVLESMTFRENTEGAAPYDLLVAATGGAIGGGVPLGVGAAIACPDRKVIVLSGDYTLIGSCKLDGNGIPPDFFSDVHVRKAFNYCFDFFG